MTRKKGFGDNWWAKRWNSVMDSCGWHSRLARGKSYARNGRVMALEISSGIVAAKVEGSRPRPYSVKIKFDRLTDKDWDAVLRVMSSQASYTALLLAGEMPQNIENAFKEASVSLFPTAGGINMQCSCPDWALPCKHIAAVFYILGEGFDEDPFLLFHLRGRTGEMIIKDLRERRAGIARKNSEEVKEETPLSCAPQPEPAESPPLEKCLDNFWGFGEGLAAFKLSMALPEVSGALIKMLGAPVFVKDKKAFNLLIEKCYSEVSKKALDVAYGLEDEEEKQD